LTFTNPDLWRKCDVQDSKSAVAALLGTDGTIGSVAAQLIEAGGYGDEMEDPI
jgi:hypothetical protein